MNAEPWVTASEVAQHLGVEEGQDAPPAAQQIPADLPDTVRRKLSERTVNVTMLPDVVTAPNGGQYIELRVPRALAVASTTDGRYFLRVADQSKPVTGDDVMRLASERSALPWETQTTDPFPDQRFDYLLANPPFGVDWKAEKKVIDRWPNFRGYSGKLPRINDGALLFLLYMMSKFQDYQPGNRDKPGSRTAVVFNGSPLFTGSAGSGESDIRRWIIERDQLETIVALPEQMFYNTGIGTFIWVVINRKAAHRRGKIQLIAARERYTPMKRSLGDKRRYLDQAALDTVTREHGAMENSQTSRVFDSSDFGYRRITVLRPLRLRFQITDEARERFLNPCPELYDALLALQDTLGSPADRSLTRAGSSSTKVTQLRFEPLLDSGAGSHLVLS